MSAGQQAVSPLITCEHGGNAVPERWRYLFREHESLLDSHLGFDRGSLDVARALARKLRAPLLFGRYTRLLVELNRSADHPRHFSKFTRVLPAGERQMLDDEYWRPHWARYGQLLHGLPGRVVHVACHSFAPVLHGREREVDVALLYDPARAGERAWCRLLADRIRSVSPDLRVRMNYPYRGTSNGMGQQHRQWFGDECLITVELEVNQALCDREDWTGVVHLLTDTIEWSLHRESSS